MTTEPTAAVREFGLPTTRPAGASRSLCHNPQANLRTLDMLAVSDFDQILTTPHPHAEFPTAAGPLGTTMINEGHCSPQSAS